MKANKLIICINKPVSEVFAFTTTPPNSTLWIPSIIKEETNEWPVRVGTVYKLLDTKGNWTEVTVVSLKENALIEWISKDKNYHCRYTLKAIDDYCTELEYYEWVDEGELEEPFPLEVLNNLKTILEK